MAALVVQDNFDLAGFYEYLALRLPVYARPLFLRIRGEIETTGTFKQTKSGLARQGFNPSDTSDVLYFNQSDQCAYVRLDRPLFDRIQSGEVRL